jgi:hypothetical protein
MDSYVSLPHNWRAAGLVLIGDMPGLFVHAVRFTLSIKEHKKVSLTY